MGNITSRSGVFKTVHAFILHNCNYMRIKYQTQIRIQELLLDYLERGSRISEEELWEEMTNICPAFCDFVSAV